MIDVKNLSSGYGDKQVLQNVSFQIKEGEFVCVLGANGCGKTTLLKTLLGMIRPSAGEVLLDGEDVHRMSEKELARKMAYIPQTHVPPFPYTVLDVVLMGRTPHLNGMQIPGRADVELAREIMEYLGIGWMENLRYTQLSGGQRQMVIIARALAQQPSILLMDEPTSSLDFGNQYLVLEQVARLTQKGMGVLMVTHDPDHAFYCADRVVALKSGKVLQTGTPEEVVSECTMGQIYSKRVSVARVTLDDGKTYSVCIPVPDR
ncbi:ABC transporter ATP-binding protein [Ethanoligenens harbinense]|uniref:ABC transporter related protein n=1 Tax=Ethanoligenens harbinense (strain DSM 18485 / JCM 12961 / CGMCC 1.5033 / YUAN-3) TaxID=663278 RepID=E6U3C4_ETHHY|nr:ABC transporter ATP-binding protein [Ethanoligenens harbinense]ADU26416.1 ABC transporter related protein [Ethanoligenens harbinense YUAN-3]AVQ95538.1 ABC transporter ATP-binding protein [Ethanoligenens harbinense YUAN-3]AYF38202.1 ABC transporter ATP-binding protein [Ethanoligenens harbinense]AYF40947.1 ABC transporter ATP-binding protein [Ethanoligenens harbinense]QCN91779.1 ABC transporter ATP-binding protein [Ethanoligenens harbinense]